MQSHCIHTHTHTHTHCTSHLGASNQLIDCCRCAGTASQNQSISEQAVAVVSGDAEGQTGLQEHQGSRHLAPVLSLTDREQGSGVQAVTSAQRHLWDQIIKTRRGEATSLDLRVFVLLGCVVFDPICGHMSLSSFHSSCFYRGLIKIKT